MAEGACAPGSYNVAGRHFNLEFHAMDPRKTLYRLFLLAGIIIIIWQLYDLVQWRHGAASRHPGVIRPWH